MKNNKKKSVKNEFASVMLASGMFAGMSTLVINATNESGIYNSNQVDVSYASTIEKPVSDIGTVSNTFTPYSEIDKDDYKKVSATKKPTIKPTKKPVVKSVKKINSSTIKPTLKPTVKPTLRPTKKPNPIKTSTTKSTSNDYDQNKKIFREMSKDDRFTLYRIVEAEATNGDKQSKKNVAHVILNRVKSNKFPNTISGVVFQKHQFSPISDGRFYSVEIKESTKQAVIEAYEEGDTTGGALYFANMSCVTNANTRKWFNSMTCLFKDSIGHSFYR